MLYKFNKNIYYTEKNMMNINIIVVKYKGKITYFTFIKWVIKNKKQTYPAVIFLIFDSNIFIRNY